MTLHLVVLATWGRVGVAAVPCATPPDVRFTAVESEHIPFSVVARVEFDMGTNLGMPEGQLGTVVPSLVALQGPLRQYLEYLDDFGSLGLRTDGKQYLILSWSTGSCIPVVDAIWRRPTETLVSLTRSARMPPLLDRACNAAVTGALLVMLVPPGEYPPVGVVFEDLPWRGE